MEKHGGCVAEWRVILLGKGLEVNAAKSIEMVGRRAFVGTLKSVCVVSVGKQWRLR